MRTKNLARGAGRRLPAEVAIVAFGLALQAGAQPTLLEPSEFSEVVREQIPVSGGVRKGLLIGSVDAIVDPGTLSVWLPPDSRDKRLCVVIDSSDGRYHADLEYLIPTDRADRYQLGLPTKHATRLRAYQAKDLAAFAYRSSGCPGKVELILPLQWGSTLAVAGELVLFVNSQGTDVRVFVPQTREYIACRRATGEARVSYDTECLIVLPEGSGVSELIITRNRYDVRLEPVPLPVYLP